jgi:hypothetical protein
MQPHLNMRQIVAREMGQQPLETDTRIESSLAMADMIQKYAAKLSRTESGSTGWKWMSSTPSGSSRSRER